MKYITIIILLLGMPLPQLQAQNKKQKTSLYFHGGKILAAEIKKDTPNLINVNKYEPSRVTKDVAWAAVVARLDKGRSLSIYDYSLKSRNKVFPCVALREMTSPFDASKWKFDKTDPRKLYSMLFKVEMPNSSKPGFFLHYNYQGQTKDIQLQFQKADYSFTSATSIPPSGIYGIPPKSTRPPVKSPPIKSPPKTNTNRIQFPKSNVKVSSFGGPKTSIDKAFDGNIKTEWHTFSKNEKHWIRIKIPGGKKPIAKMIIKWGDSYPKNYRIVTKELDKESVKFVQIFSEKNNNGKPKTININKNIEVIKIVDIDKPSSKGGAKAIFKIKEIEVYLNPNLKPTQKPTTNPTQKPATGKRITYPKGKLNQLYNISTQKNKNEVYNALDGKVDTAWKTDEIAKKHWIWVAIPGGKKTITRIVIKWGNTYPKEYSVVWSDTIDSKGKKHNLTTEKNNKGGTTTIAVNKKIACFLIQGIGRPSDSAKKYYAIKEIEVYEK